MLLELGHRVDTRAHLEDGAADSGARLVITDLIPVRSFEPAVAREWITRVRAMFPKASIVVSNAHAASAGALARGADAVLTKPFDVAVFTEAVVSMLRD